MVYPPSNTHPPNRRAREEDLSAPATQVVRDRDAYLGEGTDVGRRLSADQVELFVGDDASSGLQRELQRVKPAFIVLHDVGTSSSLRLLQAMAGGEGKLCRLVIRRQGQGIPLATLQFIELPGAGRSTLRVYSTDIDADSHARHEIAGVLASLAALAVFVFGDLPAHALSSAMQPLLDAAALRRWSTRMLLMIPLGSSVPVNSFARDFGRHGLQVHVTPRVTHPGDAWRFIGSTWNQLEGAAAPEAPPAAPNTVSGEHEPTQPMGLPRERAGIDWFDYVQRCAAVKGMVACCAFDRSSGKPLAHIGGLPSAEMMQTLGEQWLGTASSIGAMMGTGAQVLEASISSPSHHLLLHVLPSHPEVALHAVLDAATGDPILARRQLQRLDPG
ncbi:MAG TPA: hypothetical protein PKO45_06480 [Rubrivivax sp.]|nr:hypothetical protein [Burkholderiales bacterium]HNT38751.1 hypothetical protein [Rubrivivax sp.]